MMLHGKEYIFQEKLSVRSHFLCYPICLLPKTKLIVAPSQSKAHSLQPSLLVASPSLDTQPNPVQFKEQQRGVRPHPFCFSFTCLLGKGPRTKGTRCNIIMLPNNKITVLSIFPCFPQHLFWRRKTELLRKWNEHHKCRSC